MEAVCCELCFIFLLTLFMYFNAQSLASFTVTQQLLRNTFNVDRVFLHKEDYDKISPPCGELAKAAEIKAITPSWKRYLIIMVFWQGLRPVKSPSSPWTTRSPFSDINTAAGEETSWRKMKTKMPHILRHQSSILIPTNEKQLWISLVCNTF